MMSFIETVGSLTHLPSKMVSNFVSQKITSRAPGEDSPLPSKHGDNKFQRGGDRNKPPYPRANKPHHPGHRPQNGFQRAPPDEDKAALFKEAQKTKELLNQKGSNLTQVRLCLNQITQDNYARKF